MTGISTTKTCARCKTQKSVTEFGLDRGRRDQLTPWCMPCRNDSARDVRLRRRAKAVAALGGKCAECGYSKDARALQFDHVNSDGGQDRKNGVVGPAFENAIIRGERDDIQLLCANCNQIKRFEAGEWVGGRVYARVIQTERTIRPHGRSTEESRARTAEVSKGLWNDPERRARMSLAAEDGGYRADVMEAHLARIERQAKEADARREALIAVIEERRPRERRDERLPAGSWSRHYERCLGCQESSRKHAADGLCHRCYGVVKGFTRRVPTLPIAGSDPATG